MFDRVRRCAPPALAILSLTVSTYSQAADPVNGKALYNTTPGAALSCAASSCHGTDPTRRINKIQNGANNPTLIQNAIDRNTGGMGFLKPYLNATQVADIAAYIANPTATAAPGITVSSASLVFPGQIVGTASSALTVTVRSSGSAALSITNIALTGANASDFTTSGTCAIGSLASGSSCTIDVRFTPIGTGARAGTLAITTNASPATTSVALSGTGSPAPVPAINLSSGALTFAAQTTGTTSAPQVITVTNPGGASLNIGSITRGGTNAADFALSGTCANGTVLAAGTGSCTIQVAFTPSAAGARTAAIAIADNANGSPHSIALSGSGVAPAPAVTLSSASLNFGNQQVGSVSAAQTVTLTNSGTATLSITGITSSSAEFTRTTTCGASLAPAAQCQIAVTFQPTSATGKSATLSIADNATGSPHQISLAGTGTTLAGPTVTLTPATLAFVDQIVHTASAAQSVTLRNTGATSLAISTLTVGGTNAADFTRGGTCTDGLSVAPNGTCTVTITFNPAAPGARSATATLVSNAQGSPTIALSGTGLAAPVPAATLTPTTVNFGRVEVNASGAAAVTLTNTGNSTLTIGGITTSAEFTQTNNCGAGLAPAASCAIAIALAPTTEGAKTGMLEVTTNAPSSPQRVPLAGTATPDSTPAAVAPVTTGSSAPASSNAGAGGCVADPSGTPDLLLVLLALVALGRLTLRARGSFTNRQ